jgi:hypothetical protein
MFMLLHSDLLAVAGGVTRPKEIRKLVLECTVVQVYGICVSFAFKIVYFMNTQIEFSCTFLQERPL